MSEVVQLVYVGQRVCVCMEANGRFAMNGMDWNGLDGVEREDWMGRG